jgi:hypothetical protein
MSTMTFGFLRFQAGTTFDDSPRTTLEEALEALATISKTPLKSPPITDWPRITDCIRRGTLFSITAEAPALRAFLRFDPTAPNSGGYEIYVPSKRRNETGRVLSVVSIEQEDLCKHAYAMLAHFPMRYLVVTSANKRQGTQQIWLVGISAARDVSPEDLESNEEIRTI